MADLKTSWRNFRGVGDREKSHSNVGDMSKGEWLTTFLMAAVAAAAFIFAGPFLLPLLAGAGVSATVSSTIVFGGGAVFAMGATQVPRLNNGLSKAAGAVADTLGVSESALAKKQITKDLKKDARNKENTAIRDKNTAKTENVTNKDLLGSIKSNLQKGDLNSKDPIKKEYRINKINKLIDNLKLDNIDKLSPKKLADLLKTLSTVTAQGSEKDFPELNQKLNAVLDKVAGLDISKQGKLQTEMNSLLGKKDKTLFIFGGEQIKPNESITNALAGNGPAKLEAKTVANKATQTVQTQEAENQLTEATKKYVGDGKEEAQNKLVADFVKKHNEQQPESTPEKTVDEVQEQIAAKKVEIAEKITTNEFGKDSAAVAYMGLEAELGVMTNTKSPQETTQSSKHDAALKAVRDLNITVSAAKDGAKPPSPTGQQNQNQNQVQGRE
ncbi:MAG: hypothetical protein HOM96_03165 [Rickettsiales bacterium]|jgi:hypothetical protein|nr:hypothetical protein [Rickettsiales bacterium]